MSNITREQLTEITRQFRLKKRALRHIANEDNKEELGVELVTRLTAEALKAKDPVVEAKREAIKAAMRAQEGS